MIFIDCKKGQFTAQLDLKNPNYKNVYLILRGLLSVKNIKDDLYSLSYRDFKILKEKLDQFGLVSGRKMSKEALELYKRCAAQDKRNQDIKDGIHNDAISKSLAGKLDYSLP